VTFPDDQVGELVRLYPHTTEAQEAGVPYFLIPELALPAGQNPPQVDALLCPNGRDGYPSRLFLSQALANLAGRNWTNVRILERNWFAVSWRIRDGLRLAQMVRAHLDAFR